MIDLTFYFHVVCCDVIWKINRITLFLLMYQSCSFGGTFKVDLTLWWEGSLICYLENLCMMVLAISVEYTIFRDVPLYFNFDIPTMSTSY